MGSKDNGSSCRIAGVILLLLISIAALIAIGLIQDTWGVKEYSLEVSTHMYVHKCSELYKIYPGFPLQQSN